MALVDEWTVDRRTHQVGEGDQGKGRDNLEENERLSMCGQRRGERGQ